MEKEYLDLYELQTRIKKGIEKTIPGDVWVKAEVSSIKIGNGHCYLELSQSDDSGLLAKARAIIWKTKYAALASYFHSSTGSDIQEGMQILVRARVLMDQLYGLSLIINDIDADFTVGALEMERRKTIMRLQKEGLFDLQRELALPPVPCRLAIISSEDAAGYGDFMKHLHQNEYGFKFATKLFPALMQGSSAPDSILSAMNSIEESGLHFDAVLLLRGGGSPLDLVCFDDYSVAAALAECPYPVFTAIGHDRDFHIADMVAYKFVKTPTALADEFLNAYISEDISITDIADNIRRAAYSRMEMAKAGLTNLDSRIMAGARSFFRVESGKIDGLETRIMSADPRNMLQRGYVLAVDGEGVVMKSAKGKKPGDRISLLFKDGRLYCKVDEIG